MKIDSATNSLRCASQPQNRFIIEDRLRESVDMLNHRYLATPDECYHTVIALWQKETKWDFTLDQVQSILSLYPRDRILLTSIGNTIDPDVKEAMLNVLSHFFLGCKWPDFGDSVDMGRFVSLLQHQFNQAGF